MGRVVCVIHDKIKYQHFTAKRKTFAINISNTTSYFVMHNVTRLPFAMFLKTVFRMNTECTENKSDIFINLSRLIMFNFNHNYIPI